jgi:DNA-binding XRE family transcriptional regulator
MNDETARQGRSANIAQGKVSSGDNALAIVSRMRRDARTGVARRHRKSAGITQAEMARELGVTPGYLSRLERGKRSPRADLSIRWARILEELAAT